MKVRNDMRLSIGLQMIANRLLLVLLRQKLGSLLLVLFEILDVCLGVV